MDWRWTVLLLVAILLIATGVVLAFRWRPLFVFTSVYLGVALFLFGAVVFYIDRWKAGAREMAVFFLVFASMASLGYLMMTHHRVRAAKRQRLIGKIRHNAKNN